MKTLIIYDSLSGNIEIIAKDIGDAYHDMAEVPHVSEVSSPD
jgi:flavodoxin